jgi:hypothetical protein
MARRSSKRLWLLVVLPIVASCGPTNRVAEVDASQAIQLNQSVEVLQGAPPAAARSLGSIEATSCKNKAWDPAPTKENAILQLRSFAREKGANAIGDVFCDPPMDTNLGKNCWSSIRCTATAFAVQG